MDECFEMAPVGILSASSEGVVAAVNDRAEKVLGIESDAAIGRPIEAVFPESVENTLPSAFDGGFSDSLHIEEYYPGPERWLTVTAERSDETVFVYLQDVSTRHHKEQRIDNLRSDLDRVTITNELISDILAALVDASTREEIAKTICDRLGETELYAFAWVGERELGGEEIAVRASAGTTGRTLDTISDCLADGIAPPGQRAIETGTPEIVQPLGEHQSVPEPIRRAAFADGLQSVLAIPLTYGSNVYGVVGIYSAHLDAFSERERASFGTVGEMAGFAINASRHRNLLLSDTVVSLTLELTDSDAPFVSAVEHHDCHIEIDGIVPQGSELLCYLAVTDCSPKPVADTLAATDGIDSVRIIGEYDTGGAIEVRLGETTPLGILLAQVATIQHATYEDGRGECVVELSPTEDVRRIAEAVTREYDGRVIGKRQRERELTAPREFRDELSDRLTDRQENALRTAFFADYFESPRGSTAEEVASALGITGPTLLYHLRAGQRKLLAEFFDVSDER